MLHITNGTSVSLGESGLGGEVLVWRDSLPDGPVPRGLDLDALTEVRATFLTRFFGIHPEDVRQDLAERNRDLRAWRDHDEVVLWFEHDLFDQLQLLQLLDYFASQKDAAGRVSLVQADTYLGHLAAEKLAELFPSRQLVSAEQFEFGADAWAAFREPAPSKVAEFAARAELPYVAPAFRRLLEEFPSTRNGLGRTQQQMLEAVDATGPMPLRAAFVESQKREEAMFLGDSSFFAYARELASCANPLLSIHGDQASITHAGKEVLDGRVDHIELNGIDRWIGGVHLTPDRVWRWNGAGVTQLFRTT
jgi:hypothetical protein